MLGAGWNVLAANDWNFGDGSINSCCHVEPSCIYFTLY